MTRLLLLLLIAATCCALYYDRAKSNTALPAADAKRLESAPPVSAAGLQLYAKKMARFARDKRYSERVGFLVDMRLPSGLKRFFIYDLKADTVLAAGLVAHGSCNKSFLANAQFNNESGCGCTSVGRYKVGFPYTGRFGTAFKLYGLDSSNSNAFKRFVVLHAYGAVPDRETYPDPICNSLGCPMVSYKFLETASGYIRKEKKPVLMWVYY